MFDFFKSKEPTTCEKIKQYVHEALDYERRTDKAYTTWHKLKEQKYLICKDFSEFRKNLDHAKDEFDRCSGLWFYYKDKLVSLIPLDVTVKVPVDDKLYDVTHKLIFGSTDYIKIKEVIKNDK